MRCELEVGILRVALNLFTLIAIDDGACHGGPSHTLRNISAHGASLEIGFIHKVIGNKLVGNCL